MRLTHWQSLWPVLTLLLLACQDHGSAPDSFPLTIPSALTPVPQVEAEAISSATPPALATQIPQSPQEVTSTPAVTAVPFPTTASLAIDPQNSAYQGALWSVTALAPVGQTFVPTVSTLNVVALWVATGGPESVTLQVVVRQGGLDGPESGRSQPVNIPVAFADVAVFGFETAVSLQPGQLHTLEVLRVSAAGHGAVGWVQHAGWDDPYPQGQAVVQGQPARQADLWFQIGSGQ